MLPSLPILLFLAAAPAASPTWRLTAEPQDAEESALREAALRDGPAGIEALLAVTGRFPGTEVSGLARLTAGIRLLEADKAQEALPQITHEDVQRTLLRDQALFALGSAQEALGRLEPAGRSYLAAGFEPASAVVCEALPRAAELLVGAGKPGDAIPALERVVDSCADEAPGALLALGAARLAAGDRTGAARAFDRLDEDYPASDEAREARRKLAPLASLVPPTDPEDEARRLARRGAALLDARRTNDAIAALRAVPLSRLPADEADAVRVRLGRALLARRRSREGRRILAKIGPGSPYAAEAAYYLAREQVRRSGTPDAFQRVADRFAGTPWGEEALLALANHYQKDALEEQALPWWRRLLEEYRDGRYAERAAWCVGWGDFRARRYEAAAQTLETTARLRPPSRATPGFLYWSARSRLALGQTDWARSLLAETVQRYKHAYHGLRAADLLTRLGGSKTDPPALVAVTPPAEPPLPEPRATRLHELLLADLLDEAADELALVPDTPRVKATLAWIDWRLGRLRPAITAMKRAYPEWIGEAGDRLPEEVWKILFPIRYEPQLRQAASEEGLDAALVAALILQESTFDEMARSRAGARGLMQVMPATGRRIARDKGVRFRRAALHDPATSLDFGTHYLRKMSERFGGAVERVLAAYNAGPHRVDAWTAVHGELSAEEFTESIPFSETRGYVMIVLANREEYRRLYGLGRPAPGPVTEGARP